MIRILLSARVALGLMRGYLYLNKNGQRADWGVLDLFCPDSQQPLALGFCQGGSEVPSSGEPVTLAESEQGSNNEKKPKGTAAVSDARRARF